METPEPFELMDIEERRLRLVREFDEPLLDEMSGFAGLATPVDEGHRLLVETVLEGPLRLPDEILGIADVRAKLLRMLDRALGLVQRVGDDGRARGLCLLSAILDELERALEVLVLDLRLGLPRPVQGPGGPALHPGC